jgi:signal transduction histidine kinase
MKVLKNSEFKNFLLMLLIIFLILICTSLYISYITLRKVERDILNNNSKIISIILDKYPDAEVDVINSIKNMNDANKRENVLEKYGISEKDINNIYYFNNLKNDIIIINIIFLVLCFILFIVILYIFMKRFYKNIQRINNSTINVLNKNYDINVADNNEGELSILNNNIYKITTTLKEQNELLSNDKLYLKNAISDISHQLKTPLTSLYILADLLQNDIKKKDKEIFLDKIHISLDKIEWLISSLLKLAQLDSGTIILNQDDISINKLVNDTIKSLSTLIDLKELNISIKGDKNISFIGDFNWSKEALTNIIKNSAEHTPNNKNIYITWNSNPIYTEIVIKDEGKGIPESDLPFIFNRFYKAKNSNKDSIGIGLAMTKAIIKNQNGDISVKSEIDKYTEFSIKLYK